MNTNSNKVTAVSFGGGGRCGAGRHIAVANKYRNADIQVYQGTSIGGPIALLAANGYSESQMKDKMYRLWKVSPGNLVRAMIPKFVNPFKLVLGNANELRKLGSNLGLLDPTEHIEEWCQGLEWKNARFVVLDLLTRERIILDESWGMPLHLAMSATMAVPFFFSAIGWIDKNGREYLFVDGGFSHNHPTVKGHKTAVAKCLSFPGRDWLFKDSPGDVAHDIGVMPGLGVLFQPSRKEIDEQIREATERLAKMDNE